MSDPVITVVDPLLVRAECDGRLRAWAVLDQFGWAIMARVLDSDGVYSTQTVDRYEPFPGEAPPATRAAALIGLARYAATGRTDVP